MIEVMTFRLEFVSRGIPASQQSSTKVRAWKQAIRNQARAAIGEGLPELTNAMVSITFFVRPRSRNVPDVDNAAKPILDSLKGVAYADDVEVSDIICRKRFLDPRLSVAGASSGIIRAFFENRPFVHVLVTEASIWEL